MKVIVNADGVIWNENLPVLGQLGRDVIVVKYASLESFRPAHDGFTYLLVDTRKAGTPGKDAKKEALALAGGRLLEYIGDDKDVILLTDNDPVSFYPYEYLKNKFRTRRIHLLSCLPFSYESRRRKAEIKEALSDLTTVHSLCLVELDRMLQSADTQETMGRLQLRIRTFLQELLVYVAEQLPEMDEFHQYLFDPESGRYIEADLTGIIETYEKAGNAGLRQQTMKPVEAAARADSNAAAQKEFESEATEEVGDETRQPGEGSDDSAHAAEDPEGVSDNAMAVEPGTSERDADDAEADGGFAEESSTDEGRGSSSGRKHQPKEVDITYKRPMHKPSLLERLFGKKA